MNLREVRPRAALSAATMTVLVAGALGAGDAAAMSRMGELEVRLQGDVPCFTITRSERWWNGVPLIHSVSVDAQVANAAPTPIWQLRLAPHTVRLDRDTCLAYGHTQAQAESTPAPPLVPWQIYHVGMGGRTTRSSDSTQGYSADFCLVPKADGGMSVVTLAGGSIGRGQTTCQGGSTRP